MIKKGYSLLEVLLTVLIIASLLLVTLSYKGKLNLDHLTFMNEYISKQCDSFINHKRNYLSEGVNFNENGNVNSAKTIYFNNHKVIIHIGNGYITYE